MNYAPCVPARSSGERSPPEERTERISRHFRWQETRPVRSRGKNRAPCMPETPKSGRICAPCVQIGTHAAHILPAGCTQRISRHSRWQEQRSVHSKRAGWRAVPASRTHAAHFHLSHIGFSPHDLRGSWKCSTAIENLAGLREILSWPDDAYSGGV